MSVRMTALPSLAGQVHSHRACGCSIKPVAFEELDTDKALIFEIDNVSQGSVAADVGGKGALSFDDCVSAIPVMRYLGYGSTGVRWGAHKTIRQIERDF